MTLHEAMQAKGLSDAKLADALGVSREAVRLWKSSARRIAPSRVRRVGELVGLGPHELRPDLFPAPERAA